MAMRADPTAWEVGSLLDEIDASTRRVADSLATLDRERLLASSRLASWSRRTVAAHLTWVAERYVTMTGEALSRAAIATYPGGQSERAASLALFDRADAGEVRNRFEAAGVALARTWRDLLPEQWATATSESRVGPMALSRLAALRLTELEVHHVDLGLGYRVADWPGAFSTICLPLRVAWLDAHHRRRPDAAAGVVGSWLLAPIDRADGWLVTAGPGEARCEPASHDAMAEAVLTGSSASILAFLLGRKPDPPLDVRGDHRLVDAFKHAFPGP